MSSSSWRTTCVTNGGVFTRALVKMPNLDRLRARAVTFERATELYGHDQDPEETRNVAAQSEHAALVQTLRARLEPIGALTPQTP